MNSSIVNSRNVPFDPTAKVNRTNLPDIILAMGTKVYFDKPELTPYNPNEAFIHLKNLCRYHGALKVSIVQHLAVCDTIFRTLIFDHPHLLSYFLSEEQDPTIFSNGVIQRGYVNSHDIVEYVTNDIATGLKPYLNFKPIETPWDSHIHKQMGLPLEYKNELLVKCIDINALILEMALFNHPGHEAVVEAYQSMILPFSYQEFVILKKRIRGAIREDPQLLWYDIQTHINTAAALLKQHRERNG